MLRANAPKNPRRNQEQDIAEGEQRASRCDEGSGRFTNNEGRFLAKAIEGSGLKNRLVLFFPVQDLTGVSGDQQTGHQVMIQPENRAVRCARRAENQLSRSVDNLFAQNVTD